MWRMKEHFQEIIKKTSKILIQKKINYKLSEKFSLGSRINSNIGVYFPISRKTN